MDFILYSSHFNDGEAKNNHRTKSQSLPEPKTASLAGLHTSQPIYLLGRVLGTQSHQSLGEQVPGRGLPWKRPYSHPRSPSAAYSTQTPFSSQPLPALLQHRVHTTKPSPWAQRLPGLPTQGAVQKLKCISLGEHAHWHHPSSSLQGLPGVPTDKPRRLATHAL